MLKIKPWITHRCRFLDTYVNIHMVHTYTHLDWINGKKNIRETLYHHLGILNFGLIV